MQATYGASSDELNGMLARRQLGYKRGKCLEHTYFKGECSRPETRLDHSRDVRSGVLPGS